MISGSGSGFSMDVNVSPMVMPGTPAMATISPSVVCSMSMRFRPSNEKSFVILTFCMDPSVLETATSCPFFSVPLKTRPIASRPR